jgi:hypothetical protein
MISIEKALKKATIPTNRKALSVAYGNYLSNHRGYGLDFNQLREYTPGDEVKRIDWGATARSRTVQVREYTENRSIPVNFIVDCSSSMLYPSKSGEDKLNIAISVIAGLTYVANNHGDSVGALVHGKRTMFIKPKKHAAQLSRIREAIIKNFTGENIGINSSISDMLNQYLRYQQKLSVCFLITDNTNIGESALKAIQAVQTRHDIFVINIPHFDGSTTGQVNSNEKIDMGGDIVDIESGKKMGQSSIDISHLNKYLPDFQNKIEKTGILYSIMSEVDDILPELFTLMKKSHLRKTYRKFN